MNRAEMRLLDRFAEEARKAIPDLDGIVLFGSMARGDQGKGSDIDILVIVDSKEPQDYNRPLSRITTALDAELRPRRELKPVVTNLLDKDEDFLRNVFRDGIVLFGKMVLTPDRIRLKPFVLITYNVSGLSQSLKVKVSRMVHGYSGTKTVGKRKYEYKYKGLKERFGARLISPSTLLLPAETAERFTEELRKLKVNVNGFEVFV